MMDGEDKTAREQLAPERESVRPIRALMRGFEILQELNRFASASVTDIAKAVRLPRTTTYRVLETLCAMGFAVRNDLSDRYHIMARVRSLSDGFDDEGWINAIAKPALAKTAKDMTWPLILSTLQGMTLLARDVTVRDATMHAALPGTWRTTLLTSSSGRVCLAMCGEEQRATLLDILARSERPEDRLARDKSLMNRIVAEVRNNGWALYDEPALTELGLAVPIMTRNRFLASLTMRFMRAALTPEQAVEKYLPLLKRAAADVGEAFENHAPSE